MLFFNGKNKGSPFFEYEGWVTGPELGSQLSARQDRSNPTVRWPVYLSNQRLPLA